MERTVRKRKVNWKKILFFVIVSVVVLVIAAAIVFAVLSSKSYTADDFDIKTVKSAVDFDNDGTDDYTDFLIGAKKDAENHPTYDGRYWDGGYPPDDIGVCTDVIWRAFANAGYCLRDMVDYDVKDRPGYYPTIEVPDKNIDFRRGRNLQVFFEKYGEKLTLDVFDTDQWQPGDIIVFGNKYHFGMVSDKRNFLGIPYIIHNSGQKNREEDILLRGTATAHYRFDAENLPDYILIPME